MSWQHYVDKNLVGSLRFHRAAIVGLDGTVWAVSSDWKLTPQEIKNILATFQEPAETDSVPRELSFAGEHHIVARADERSIYTTKVRRYRDCIRASMATWQQTI
jgi:profilin